MFSTACSTYESLFMIDFFVICGSELWCKDALMKPASDAWCFGGIVDLVVCLFGLILEIV